jgi:hypothetical protein
VEVDDLLRGPFRAAGKVEDPERLGEKPVRTDRLDVLRRDPKKRDPARRADLERDGVVVDAQVLDDGAIERVARRSRIGEAHEPIEGVVADIAPVRVVDALVELAAELSHVPAEERDNGPDVGLPPVERLVGEGEAAIARDPIGSLRDPDGRERPGVDSDDDAVALDESHRAAS